MEDNTDHQTKIKEIEMDTAYDLTKSSIKTLKAPKKHQHNKQQSIQAIQSIVLPLTPPTKE
jgi:hypothetical protein